MTGNSYNVLKTRDIPAYKCPLFFFTLHSIYYLLYNICTIITYKDEGGCCDNSFWQTLTKVVIDLYIYNVRDKPLYIYSGLIFFLILILILTAYNIVNNPNYIAS